MIPVFIVHIGLAVLLFYTSNKLGHYAPDSLKYFSLETYDTELEAPALNYLLRVLTPIVFLILVSTFFYWLHLDRFVVNLYMVSIYNVILRTSFIIMTNKGMLVNWIRYTVYSSSIIFFSWLLYMNFFKYKVNLLPDWNSIANEVWVVIILFLYKVINEAEKLHKKPNTRKDRYITNEFEHLKSKFGKLITQETSLPRLQQIAYAIIIYESFNRPKAFRLIENLRQVFSSKPHSMGIMQVQSRKLITDVDSVRLGMRKLVTDFEQLQKEFKEKKLDKTEEGTADRDAQKDLVQKYNYDRQYSDEVLMIADKLSFDFFDKTNNLFSNTSTPIE